MQTFINHYFSLQFEGRKGIRKIDIPKSNFFYAIIHYLYRWLWTIKQVLNKAVINTLKNNININVNINKTGRKRVTTRIKKRKKKGKGKKWEEAYREAWKISLLLIHHWFRHVSEAREVILNRLGQHRGLSHTVNSTLSCELGINLARVILWSNLSLLINYI